MTNEEAKITILNIWDRYENKTGNECTAIEMAIEALEQTRWIPVSGRLPEIGQDVLCILKVDDVNRRIAVCKCKQEVWWYYAIAWMPLPKPYKEESEDKE